ncbi:MAG: efflux transporter outer membrane subunit [Methylobacter sp.]|nr:efflux transporter outer membrane subunit [Methylobacter sp.]MDP2427369.1 efflux transporter outer membrane subunit [Methylobacter sp.]MDP3055403.1 efflux transporter outer membrane subunit [Methylobacter sp.]MDP3361309.1 efflux transporter outer membrane subunit [Methylobacter sp.]MDZ4217517.1 efflux transporter outer membrane subunit [Methylobacter sp.]
MSGLICNTAAATAATLRTLSCTVILLTACATAPERDAISMTKSPSQWTTVQSSNNPITAQWLSSFANPALSALVQDALNNNYDLKAAAARVDSAREQARIDGSPRWPQLFFISGYRRDALTASETGAFEALFAMSWEIDVWGRIKAAQQATVQEAEAVAADYHGAQLSLAARTAQSYFELIEANLQIEVAEQSIKDRRTIVELVRGRFARGLTRGLDLRLVLTDLANAEAQLASSRNRGQIVTRRLEVLLGRYPGNNLKKISALPEPPTVLSAGLPSELLARRPDLVAALSRLQASDSRVESAKKALLPRITLTAAGGTSSPALTELIDPRAVAWNLAMGLVQPIFTGGRLKAGIRLNEARTEEAFNQYQSTALNAFREVEQTLAAEQWLREEEQALKEAVEQTQASRKLAVYSYRQGLIEILTLLDSYRSTLNAQSAHLSVQRQLLSNRIDLYLALGGGV